MLQLDVASNNDSLPPPGLYFLSWCLLGKQYGVRFPFLLLPHCLVEAGAGVREINMVNNGAAFKVMQC